MQHQFVATRHPVSVGVDESSGGLRGYQRQLNGCRTIPDCMRVHRWTREVVLKAPWLSTNTSEPVLSTARYLTQVRQCGRVSPTERYSGWTWAIAITRLPTRCELASYWIRRNSSEMPPYMENRRERQYNGHFGSMCYHPLYRVQPVRGLRIGGHAPLRATYIARTGGGTYWSQSWPRYERTGVQPCTFGPMPPSPSRISMSTSRSGR